MPLMFLIPRKTSCGRKGTLISSQGSHPVGYRCLQHIFSRLVSKISIFNTDVHDPLSPPIQKHLTDSVRGNCGLATNKPTAVITHKRILSSVSVQPTHTFTRDENDSNSRRMARVTCSLKLNTCQPMQTLAPSVYYYVWETEIRDVGRVGIFFT